MLKCNGKMKKEASIRSLKRRYERLAAQLAQVGYLIPGTINERIVQGRAEKKQVEGKEYGPYYQWTRKVEGKTRTRNLSEMEAAEYARAIENNRKVEAILQEMRAVSLNILEKELVGVTKRKRT
jgi:hypothetical protein